MCINYLQISNKLSSIVEVEKYVTYHIFNVKEYLIQKIYLYLITTRWNTWFRMAFHVYQNLDYIRGFYNEEGKENSTPIIEKINSAFTDQQINGRIEIYLTFIQENS